MPTDFERQVEIGKYDAAYRWNWYRMTPRLGRAAREVLESFPRGSLLDVGTGRGELLDIASDLGYYPVQGTEVVDSLLAEDVIHAHAHSLPFADGSYDTVCCLDVLEHLLPDDDMAACKQLARVAYERIVVSVANWSAVHEGIELHVNRREYTEWDALLRQWCPKFEVTPRDLGTPSQWWILERR